MAALVCGGATRAEGNVRQAGQAVGTLGRARTTEGLAHAAEGRSCGAARMRATAVASGHGRTLPSWRFAGLRLLAGKDAARTRPPSPPHVPDV